MQSAFSKIHLLLLSFPLLFLACTIHAPEDYYFQFALMEEWGKHNRQETGRMLHQVSRHPENTDPLVIAFEVGEPPAELLGFVSYDIPVPPATGQSPTNALPKVPISLQQEALRQLFNERQIRVIHWRLKNGRLEGKPNIVLLNFIPRAFSDRAIKEEFLMICAIVHGAQTQGDTIDVIRGIAEEENGTPQMSLEAQITNYRAYLRGQIDGQQWEEQLRLQRF
jgi:hypothetical protein